MLGQKIQTLFSFCLSLVTIKIALSFLPYIYTFEKKSSDSLKCFQNVIDFDKNIELTICEIMCIACIFDWC